ncbi:rhodanese-like domain-containing protein [Ammoniphilus resinae]|uniref:Rhodanese-related sulfurtransferase n=1 Tax=Ammoniphilus resinae TaxID=861532 RepID=A0ABS4GTC4_9BACL|nr:rhodanese-like domain-containing protein [Ammoniphilus resinae]MBP1933501.1 rhodanese-related sulfurtransferase [Ammoniphilus resinae]
MEDHFISAGQFVEKYKARVLKPEQVIDVREPYEWEMFHLEESTLIPMNTIPEQLEQLPKDQPLYIVCGHGVRSWHVTNFLLQQGFDQVINVEGGMAEVALFLQERGE